MKKALVFAISMMLLVCSLECAAENETESTWLHGKWELSYDPDGSSKDYLTFKSNGTVVNSAPGHSDISGTYSVSEDSIKIVFKQGGKQFSMELKPADNKTKLLFYSARTGNTAEYTRSK